MVLPTFPQRLLMIDNYDSFTFNLVQYFGQLGATVEVVRNDQWTVEEALARFSPEASERFDALVISPGPCSPAEAGISVPLIQAASGRIPLLGVCLGHQSLTAAFGGKVVRAGEIMHGKTSPVAHRDTDLFQGMPQPFLATRYHSLIAEEESLPTCLEVTAWCERQHGGRLIMGLAHRDHPSYGVQFHPESILTQEGHRLLANFLALSAAFHARNPA